MTPAEIYGEFKKCGGVADLSARAKLRLTGGDRVRFLNGQVSNDVRKLAENGTLHACVLTAKGRLCADVFIASSPDFLRVDAEPELRESLAARLERCLIADDVTLEDASEEMGLLHRIFPAGTQTGVHGDAAYQIFHANRFGSPGLDMVAPREAVAALRASLSNDVPLLDAAMLETIRVEAGVPRWGFELGEEILPQEAGLDRDAIDFHKGCYVGQEVISRIKSVGHVNKQLRGFVRIGEDAPLRAGMKLFAPGHPEKEAGSITSAAYSFGLARHAALGYLKRGVSDAVLDARDESGACRVELKNLPLIP